MKHNKFLQKQIDKYLSEELLQNKELQSFIESVSASFDYNERDKQLSERAFKISEEEYQLVNAQLKKESEEKNRSIRNLKEGLGLVGSENIASDDLFQITELLNQRLEERNKALAGISESEERNRMIMNAALDAIIMINKDGNITFWNKQAEEVFGWKEDEIINSRLSNYIIPEQYREAHLKGMKRYLSTKEGPVIQKQIEITAMRKNGEEFPVELYIIPIEQNGEALFCAFIRDISLRKKTEEELKQTSQVARLNKNGVILTDYKGRITWSNDQFAKMTAFEVEEISGLTPIQLLRGEKSEKDKMDELLHHFVDGTDFELEILAQKKSKKYFWARCTGQVMKGETFNENKYFVIVEDVTEKKAMNEKLRLQEEKYRNIITNMNLGLLEVDNNDMVQFANQSFLEMSGYSLKELQGKEARKVFVDKEFISKIEDKNEIRETGKSDAYELKIKTKKGDSKWWLISGAPRFDDQGELVGSIGIHLDITEQKRTQRKLQSSLRQLEVANNGLKDFAHVVSHDLKSPLRSISGLVQILQEDYQEKFDTEGKQIVEDVITRTEHMDELIGGILAYSSVQHSKEKYKKFSTKEVVDKLIKYIEMPKNIKLEFEGDFPEMRMNPTHFQQLIQNLVTNAIKYNDKEKPYIKIIAEEDSKSYSFAVEDNGQGIEPRNQKKIFDMYQKFDNRGNSSTGIGLAIVKKIVELYQGKLSLHSEVGVGSTFKVHFPKI